MEIFIVWTYMKAHDALAHTNINLIMKKKKKGKWKNERIENSFALSQPTFNFLEIIEFEAFLFYSFLSRSFSLSAIVLHIPAGTIMEIQPVFGHIRGTKCANT